MTYARDQVTWLSYLLLAFYGFFINVIGPITPFLKDELGLSYTLSSLHYTAFALGILLVGLGGNLAIARLGRRGALWLGAAGLSLGACLLIAGQTPVLTIGAAFLMGLVGSLILVIIPSALSDRHGELRAVALSEANVVASLVSSAAPLLVGAFGRSPGGWRWALGLAALTPLLLYPLFRRVRLGEPGAAAASAARLRRPLPRLYWAYWASLFLAVAAEFCMISWSASYLQAAAGLPQASAAQAVSLFLAAMIAGRLAGSRLVQRFSMRRLVPLSVLIGMAGFLLFWSAASTTLTLGGLFLSGLGIASLYPFILSLAINAAGSESVQASTRATLASGLAILSLPLALGRLADAVGIRQAYGVELLLLTGVLVIVLAAERNE